MLTHTHSWKRGRDGGPPPSRSGQATCPGRIRCFLLPAGEPGAHLQLLFNAILTAEWALQCSFQAAEHRRVFRFCKKMECFPYSWSKGWDLAWSRAWLYMPQRASPTPAGLQPGLFFGVPVLPSLLCPCFLEPDDLASSN